MGKKSVLYKEYKSRLESLDQAISTLDKKISILNMPQALEETLDQLRKMQINAKIVSDMLQLRVKIPPAKKEASTILESLDDLQKKSQQLIAERMETDLILRYDLEVYGCIIDPERVRGLSDEARKSKGLPEVSPPLEEITFDSILGSTESNIKSLLKAKLYDFIPKKLFETNKQFIEDTLQSLSVNDESGYYKLCLDHLVTLES